MRTSLVIAAALAVSLSAGCRQAPAAEASSAAQLAKPEQAPAPPKPMPATLPDVLARVNGEPVTKVDFDRFIKNLEAARGPVPQERRDDIYRAALDQLITYNVMKQEATSRKVEIADADLESRVQQMQGKMTAEQFDKALAERDTSATQLRTDTRRDMMIRKMMEGEVASVAEATEPEAKDFYDKNPDKFKQAELLRASHILVKTDEQADEATKKQARAKIDDILKRLRAGEDFAKLARENSDDGTKDQGGDLGFFRRGQMVPPFDQAAFALQPGETSDVVTTQFGYHIIKSVERKDAQVAPYDKVQPQILKFLSDKKKQDRVNAFIEELKQRAKIEVLV